MSRCIYCNKETPTYIMVKSSKKDNAKEYPCCSLKCFNKAKSFLKYNHIAMWILILFIILVLTLGTLAILDVIPSFYMEILIVLAGAGYIVFPYCIKFNASYECIKKNKLGARILGVGLASMIILPYLLSLFQKYFLF